MEVDMKCKQLMQFALAGVTVWVATPANAGSCSLIPDTGDGKAQVQIGAATQTLDAAKHLTDCSSIVLKSGTAFLLYEVDGEHQVKACKINEPCATPAQSGLSFLAPGEGGAKRVGQGLDKDYARLSGLPYGWVMRAESLATFSLARVQESVQKFTLFDQSQQPLVQAGAGQSSVAVPIDALKPGERYRWQLVTDKAQHEGSFRMIDDKKKLGIVKTLEAARQASPNASVFEKKLQELAVYRDYDLGYEMERLRQEMKL
jgi:hypothetical protein